MASFSVDAQPLLLGGTFCTVKMVLIVIVVFGCTKLVQPFGWSLADYKGRFQDHF